MIPSSTHLLLVNGFDPVSDIRPAASAALAYWQPVWVVLDHGIEPPADPGLRVVRLKQRDGKGAAVRHALLRAEREGFTHALVMGTDDAAVAPLIPAFMAASQLHPAAMILGQSATRGLSRRLCHGLVGLLTSFRGIGDPHCGFRVYPIRPLLEVMATTRGMRGTEFEAEAAVRLSWRGVRPVRLPAKAASGGRGLLGAMHVRLFLSLLTRP